MKMALSLLPLLLLAAPSAANLPEPAQMTAPAEEPASPSGMVESGSNTVLAAAAVVRGPRGRRAVIVAPRGRARTFVYRGRPLTVIRRPRFVYPAGVVYRRWRLGDLLPIALIATPFFFLDYQALGVRPPPAGYQWVQNGPDVVLVNVQTRKIEDVAYGAIGEEDD